MNYLTETVISLLKVDLCDIWVSISYSDQILGKRESQTRKVFNSPGISFRGYLINFCGFE